MTPSEALAEARRRIAIARDCHIPWLDLGDLGLEEIPQEIGELSGLRRLALGRCELREESANSQWEWDPDRPWSSLTSAEPLRGLSGLATLDLAGCGQLTDVSVLAGLTALTSLNLSGCRQLTDVSGLAGLTALTSLNLSGCEQLTDVSGVSRPDGTHLARPEWVRAAYGRLRVSRPDGTHLAQPEWVRAA